MRRAALQLALATVMALALARSARAEDADTAEKLYQQGRQSMADGRIAEACVSFAESQRIDPATGTLLNLATCHEAEGKLATAWREFEAAAAASRRDGRADREEYARQHLDGISPRLSYVTISVPDAGRADALEVKLDGVVLPAASWGVATPLDPGVHDVAATATGRVPFAARVTVTHLARPQTITVTLVPVPVAAPVVTQAPVEPTPASAPGERTPPARVAGFVVGGAAVVALGVGAVFAWRAKDKWDARNSGGLCDADDRCAPQGIEYGNQAQTAATIANVAFIAAGVGAVTATYLLWIRGDAPSTSASSGTKLRFAFGGSPAGGSASLGGTW